MMLNQHRLGPRDRSSRLRRDIGLGLLLGALLLLLPAAGAAGYTFTQVKGSPFSAGGFGACDAGRQVVFSPNGAILADASQRCVWEQTVSKSGKFGTPKWVVSPDICKGKKSLLPSQGFISAVALSSTGGLLAEAETPGVGQTHGTLRIYKRHGTRLRSASCRTLPYTGKVGTGFPGNGDDYAVAFGPNNLLAVTNMLKDTVSVYSVSKAGKTYPVSGSPFFTGKAPDAVAFGPTQSGGEALAVANQASNDVSMFTVYGGVIAPAAGSPFTTLPGPSSLAFSPAGGLLAVAESGATELTMYQVSYTGNLTGVAGAHTGGAPQSIAFSRDGGLVATASSSNVSVFSVAASGQVAQVSGSPFSPKGAPDSIAFSPTRSLLALASPTGYTGHTLVYSYK